MNCVSFDVSSYGRHILRYGLLCVISVSAGTVIYSKE